MAARSAAPWTLPVSGRTKRRARRLLIAGAVLILAPLVYLLAATLFAAPGRNLVPPTLPDLLATPFGQLSFAIFLFGTILTVRGLYVAAKNRLVRRAD